MFGLFFSLYLAMFTGSWSNFSSQELFGSTPINDKLKSALNNIGALLTNMFNDTGNYQTFGDGMMNIFPEFISLVLATITSIGIVVMAVKGIKRVFGVFFMGIR